MTKFNKPYQLDITFAPGMTMDKIEHLIAGFLKMLRTSDFGSLPKRDVMRFGVNDSTSWWAIPPEPEHREHEFTYAAMFADKRDRFNVAEYHYMRDLPDYPDPVLKLVTKMRKP